MKLLKTFRKQFEFTEKSTGTYLPLRFELP